MCRSFDRTARKLLILTLYTKATMLSRSQTILFFDGEILPISEHNLLHRSFDMMLKAFPFVHPRR
jgi:hypothetical protein